MIYLDYLIRINLPIAKTLSLQPIKHLKVSVGKHTIDSPLILNIVFTTIRQPDFSLNFEMSS